MITPYYSEDGITIYNADCREVLQEIRYDNALVLTDPPYNAENIGVHSRIYAGGQQMKLADEDYRSFCTEWFNLCQKISNGILMTSGIANLWLYPQAKWILIWNKPGAVSYNRTGGFNIWEPILLYGDSGRFTEDVYTSTPPNLLRGPEREHPCPKPLGLYKWLLLPSGKRPVVDPFFGSGTTGVACKELGRECIGIEISERYCEIAVNRLRQMELKFDEG
jgi:DNA modification methylase